MLSHYTVKYMTMMFSYNIFTDGEIFMIYMIFFIRYTYINCFVANITAQTLLQLLFIGLIHITVRYFHIHSQKYDYDVFLQQHFTSESEIYVIFYQAYKYISSQPVQHILL
jgi:hypothetical protein